ncbi:hypothetical protein OO013_07635 [Mangrovivirga sp. M17]|uniref:Guanylate cyclase domain-containing protein n=1 Tax=Mangrovivirga halotolerans TaxID=2993936 RepID=A0ABT3RQ46_9BACT|nr:hypothetical protein [Mangrovivirga halotolerans]MCX2743730.1 hypothetical protein [Mangrovivirga halotolerans]
MKYDIRVVAFIDILGFKNAVDSSLEDDDEFNRIKTALTDLNEFFITPKDKYEIDADRKLNTDTQIIQVSDSLVISRLIQEQGGIYYMLSDCAFAIHLLISNGFLCRGSIKAGYLHHTESTMFGEAFIRAYQSEAEEILPIVKFEKELFDVVKLFPGPANKDYEEWEIDFIKKNCKQLNEKEYYLDYFTDYDDLVGGGEGTAAIHYQKLREIIIDGLKLPAETSAYKKYKWASEQFNLSAERFGLEKINE